MQPITPTTSWLDMTSHWFAIDADILVGLLQFIDP